MESIYIVLSGMLGIAVELLKLSREKNVPFIEIGISRMLYGLQKLSSDSPEVRDMLSVLSDIIDNCEERFGAQSVGNSLYGLQSMSSEYVEMRTLLASLAVKVADCHTTLRAQHVGNALYGLQSMSSEHIEVRMLLDILAVKVSNCQETLNAQAACNALYGLQNMNSEHIEVRTLLVALAVKVADCEERLGAQTVGNALYGLQNMNSKYPEVRSLLSVLTDKVKDCQKKLGAQHVGNALYGLQNMNSEHIEVRKLLGALAIKVKDCQETLCVQVVSNALYGLQSMNSEHADVKTLMNALKDKLTQFFDKGTSEHSNFDVLELLRSFMLFRHHIVTILGSEALCIEYHRKLDAELVSRRQRGGPFSAVTAFQSTFEKDVYNRVVALSPELQISNLRHNLHLLDCFESDITFTVLVDQEAAVVVNVEVDGVYHENKRKKRFCQLRDKELMSRGIHVVRITTRKAPEIDAILRTTGAHVRTTAAGSGPMMAKR